MTHPLANDATAPDSIRRAFARVTCKVVCTFADGHSSDINCVSAEQAERIAAERRAILASGGGRYRSLVGPSYETKLTAVTVESI